MNDINLIVPSFESVAKAIADDHITFPLGTNVEFVQIISRSHLVMKVTLHVYMCK